MSEIKRALVSVSDKAGIVSLARTLVNLGVEIISTGGTARHLKENGIETRSVSDLTAFPEILSGRVKTLHPKIFAGLLALREDGTQMAEVSEHEVDLIDLVVVNLYPFESTIARADCTLLEALENIDIGGPSLIRAASKNYLNVAVVTNPEQYPEIETELKSSGGEISLETRRKLARSAFQLTAQYDSLISSFLLDGENKLNGEDTRDKLPVELDLSLTKLRDLRYGENPHQRGAFYRQSKIDILSGLAKTTQLHGKELSFNNLLDLNAACGLVAEFEQPCVVIIKHSNPCGLAVGTDLREVLSKAIGTDPVSSFGGIIGVNRRLDAGTAQVIAERFVEAVIAPNFEEDALSILKTKKNLRILKHPEISKVMTKGFDIKSIDGGLLIQDQDLLKLNDISLRVVSERQPNQEEWEALRLGWRVCKWVKSNAIVFAQPDRTIGIGAGQMSRVDSSRIAIERARRFELTLADTAVASDAFFPFRDGVDIAAEAGATAVIQPGGSIRDEEVIQAVNEHSMAMVFSGVRHFKH